ncbi:hypothetical protein JW916_14770 [Candidatus Sumerlaeota bacterium]|nr:hypothetical protein [Candidatus Sumerlaeota bacterium]
MNLSGYLVVLVCLLIAIVYVGLRIDNSSRLGAIKFHGDSAIYLNLASKPVFKQAFWGRARPLGVPLFYKALGSDAEKIGVAQTSMSMIAWIVLAATIAVGFPGPWFRPAAFALILVLGLERHVIMWDWSVFSESPALSLQALFIAGWFWIASRWSWPRAAFLLSIGVLLMFTRETFAWLLLILALGILPLAGFKRRFRRYLVFCAVFPVFFLLSQYTSNKGRRWEYPFLNVFAQRILTDPHRTAWFERRGMPVTPALMERRGKWGGSDDRSFYRDPRLEEFRAWMHSRGKRAYVLFLLTHPLQSFCEATAHVDRLFAFMPQTHAPDGFEPIMNGGLDGFLALRAWRWTLWVPAGTFVLVALAAARPRRSAPWVALLTLVLAYLHFVIVWHGDAMEVGRHSLAAGVQFRVAFWTLLLFSLQAACNRFSQYAKVRFRRDK